MVQVLIHYGIHFLFPLLIAFLYFKPIWLKAYLIMIACILIDLDHLLATPIFDANRCSLNFHPLHSYFAIGCYILLSLIKKSRLLGLGLLIHILADSIDCLLM